MGFIYILIIGIILTVIIAFSYDWEGSIAMGLILSLLAGLLFIISAPTETVDKIEIDRTVYKLVPLINIEPNKDYSDNDYVIYTSEENYGVYIIDKDGVIKYKSFSEIEICYSDETPELHIIDYDYENGFLQHIYPNLIKSDKVIIIPKDSTVRAVAPQIPELNTRISE